jgi:hypothetical protein
VVPAPTVQAQPIEALPEAPARAKFNDGVKRIDHLDIALHGGLARLIEGRPGQADDDARLAHGHAALLNEVLRRKALG